MKLTCHLSFFHLESHFVDNNAKFLVQCVIFDHQEILRHLFHDFSQRELINLTKGNQPADLLPDLLEDTLPIDHLLKFILNLVFLLHLDLLLFDTFGNLFELWDNI